MKKFVLGALAGAILSSLFGYAQQPSPRPAVSVDKFLTSLLGSAPNKFEDNVLGIQTLVWPRYEGSLILVGPFRPQGPHTKDHYDASRAFVPGLVGYRRASGTVEQFVPLGDPFPSGWHFHVGTNITGGTVLKLMATPAGGQLEWSDATPFRKEITIE